MSQTFQPVAQAIGRDEEAGILLDRLWSHVVLVQGDVQAETLDRLELQGIQGREARELFARIMRYSRM